MSLEILKQDIEKEVSQVLYVFEPINCGFVLNFIYDENIVLQVVHQAFIDQLGNNTDKFGFGLNITFDPEFPGDEEKKQKFLETEISTKFISYLWEGIPCYAIGLGKSVKYVVNTSAYLLELFGYTENISFELIDEGAL
jgi:hypothetical protein